MKVVISWAGDRSKHIALALRKFLKLVIQATEPWVSAKDIAAGSFWHEELWEQLEKAKAGIICLTPETLESRWVHFEAGALAKAMGKIWVSPYLFELRPSDVQGPLSFLQCVDASKQGTAKLLQDVNRALGNSLTDEELRDSFDAHWPEFEKQLKSVPARTGEKPKRRPTEDLLEEMLAGIRDLQDRVAPKTVFDIPLLQLDNLEAWAIKQALRQTDNNISAAARLLGIARDTFHAKMKRYEIGKSEE